MVEKGIAPSILPLLSFSLIKIFPDRLKLSISINIYDCNLKVLGAWMYETFDHTTGRPRILPKF